MHIKIQVQIQLYFNPSLVIRMHVQTARIANRSLLAWRTQGGKILVALVVAAVNHSKSQLSCIFFVRCRTYEETDTFIATTQRTSTTYVTSIAYHITLGLCHVKLK